ncbi:phosphodiesterase [Pseudomonas citronellolis]|uniref:phosphodiesterase n=1 Tax=Pseudomonas citronellolis TaxID=53408 RepID=UPI0021BFDDAA|nr:phosphodiesterase [Pseudomonas citronellolis]UXJ51017.1 phosphodiesterase [Pseudomonas citronellolis]
MKALYIPFLLLCLGAALPAAADTLEIPVGAQGDASIALPARGESRRAVLERFGLPDEEHPAVGSPPITRWDYREFSVYFEYDHVVDAVRAHRPQNPIPSSPKEPQ